MRAAKPIAQRFLCQGEGGIEQEAKTWWLLVSYKLANLFNNNNQNETGSRSRQPPLRRRGEPFRRLGHGPRRAAVLPVRFRVGAGVESRRRVDAEQLLER